MAKGSRGKRAIFALIRESKKCMGVCDKHLQQKNLNNKGNRKGRGKKGGAIHSELAHSPSPSLLGGKSLSLAFSPRRAQHLYCVEDSLPPSKQ